MKLHYDFYILAYIFYFLLIADLIIVEESAAKLKIFKNK